MAWADSRIFRPFLENAFKNLSAYDLDGDTFKAALYNNSITPDNDVTQANSAYNVGQWATANEVYEAGTWAQGGVALTTPTVDASVADTVFWDAVDTASSAGADLASVYGCLVYDTTVTSYGITYNYFGGTNSVTNGTFTIVWHANGIFRITL
jgi:hypothetical protein